MSAQSKLCLVTTVLAIAFFKRLPVKFASFRLADDRFAHIKIGFISTTVTGAFAVIVGHKVVRS